MGKPYSPRITVRYRPFDSWYGAECPDCGASILHKTPAKVKNAVRKHGEQHNWLDIKFDEQL